MAEVSNKVTPRSIRELLLRYGLTAHRSRGQNFLVDPGIARRLVEIAEVGSGDTVIEIGAGLGTLTCALAARAKHVMALEIDAGLLRVLRGEKLLPDNVELIHADARKFDWENVLKQKSGGVRLVANLPYSVATPLLRRFLDIREQLLGWSVMVQRELAQRLLAQPGNKSYSSLTVLHCLCAQPTRGLDLRPGCFYPAPAVTSTFLRFQPVLDEELEVGELEEVERVTRFAFLHRRKMISNALADRMTNSVILEKTLNECGILANSRPEEVTPLQWLKLSRLFIKKRNMLN